ncbi:F-box protein At4g00755-like [Andrographis paniculata]|uniref:F-box protein At4g00755-like n=1 Tax=Andrographis paniculata TaxID=175694 RepID=UPI0021E98A2E|nr:F-box protein At4g00755-like [Andrographis paniculata]
MEIIITILTLLIDPVDMIRMSAVTRTWYHFVVQNGIAKTACRRRAPMLKNTSYCDAIMNQRKKHHLPRFNDLRKEHKLYSSLLAILSKASMINPKNCIGFVIGASSTSHYIGKSIIHALLPNKMYWSSKGHTDANVSETILFKLNGGVCIVSDIQIQPSPGHYGNRQYIFSAMSLQLSMGHSTLPKYQTHQDINLPGDIKDDHFVWGYTSPQFPMEQVMHWQLS